MKKASSPDSDPSEPRAQAPTVRWRPQTAGGRRGVLGGGGPALLPTYDVLRGPVFRPGSPGLGPGAGGGIWDHRLQDAWQAAGLTPVGYGVGPVANLPLWSVRTPPLRHGEPSASPTTPVADRIPRSNRAARLGTPFLLANQWRKRPCVRRVYPSSVPTRSSPSWGPGCSPSTSTTPLPPHGRPQRAVFWRTKTFC
ncbi:MAG: hypothetical protein CM15mP18_5190 [Methanobacteriota archaeon]|nr:MAG: hypothetical protein CM15mP18_5190 [Euryarchaeota archaeon]